MIQPGYEIRRKRQQHPQLMQTRYELLLDGSSRQLFYLNLVKVHQIRQFLAAIKQSGRKNIARLKILVDPPEMAAQVRQDGARELIDQHSATGVQRLA